MVLFIGLAAIGLVLICVTLVLIHYTRDDDDG